MCVDNNIPELLTISYAHIAQRTMSTTFLHSVTPTTVLARKVGIIIFSLFF